MIQIVLSLASCNTLNLRNWNSGFVKLGVRWVELTLEDKENKTKQNMQTRKVRLVSKNHECLDSYFQNFESFMLDPVSNLESWL